MTPSPTVLILTSDAGSGHRSAAAAIAQHITPFATPVVVNPAHHPMASQAVARAEKLYLEVVNSAPEQYAFAHEITDAPGLDVLLEYSLASTLRRSLVALVAAHQPQVVVSVYPLLTRILAGSLPKWKRPRMMTVVTDLGNVHRAWFSTQDDLIAVPSVVVRDKAVKCGIDVRKLVHTGLPILPAFVAPCASVSELRHELGWDATMPTLLLLGGGAGVGPVRDMAYALDAAAVPVQLAIVAGRNSALADELRQYPWQQQVHIYDFVPLADMMHACDVVASKAGGLTVSECMAAGKPMVFYGEAPGQEEGNRTLVMQAGAGLYAHDTAQFVGYARMLLADSDIRHSMAVAARRIGMPHAAQTVANEIQRLVQYERTMPHPLARYARWR
jgi:1,2-diacylglycerol 3-beta-galactosyltransferase